MKTLQSDSKYNVADMDGDGIVTDEEMARHAEFIRLENEDAKEDAQRRMAWFALSGMLLYPFAVVISIAYGLDTASTILGDMAGAYFVSTAGITAAFFGSQAWSKGK